MRSSTYFQNLPIPIYYKNVGMADSLTQNPNESFSIVISVQVLKITFVIMKA